MKAENDRVRAHAACDLALIPRRTAGGLPIKLLESLARARPTVAVRRATAGLAINNIAWLADDDSPRALARAIQDALEGRHERESRAQEGRSFIQTEHSEDSYIQAMHRATGFTADV